MISMIYNKLVRDNIANIIREDGKTCTTKTLSTEEYRLELKRKLIEESQEVLASKTREEVIEELADVYEVIEAIMFEEKIDLIEIQDKRVCKNMKKGAFEEKLYLIEVK